MSGSSSETEEDEDRLAKGGGRASALLTLVTESPVPAVSGWSSPRPTDAFSDRAGVPPLWQLVGISVPAPTHGIDLGDLVRAHVRGIGQWRQLSPSSWGLGPRACGYPWEMFALGQTRLVRLVNCLDGPSKVQSETSCTTTRRLAERGGPRLVAQ